MHANNPKYNLLDIPYLLFVSRLPSPEPNGAKREEQQDIPDQ